MYKTVAQQAMNDAAAEAMQSALNKARNEAMADAAVKFSSHLDSLINHIVKNGFSRPEIIDLLGQESEKLHNQGLESRGVH